MGYLAFLVKYIILFPDIGSSNRYSLNYKQVYVTSSNHLMYAPVLSLRSDGKINGGIRSPSRVITQNTIMFSFYHLWFIFSDCTLLKFTLKQYGIFVLMLKA